MARQPQPDHVCPCGCGARVSYRRLACRDGWHSLPRDLQARLTEHRQGTGPHLTAVIEAIAFLKQRRTAASTPDGGRPC